jgi:alpha-ribazole phosphatase
MKLWLLRHAQVLAEPGLCYGISDLPADPTATAEAARRFAPCPAAGSALWCSPSQRTVELAQALRQHRPDLPEPVVDERLREMDFGRWEMQPWDRIDRSAIDAWVADFGAHRFGGRESAQEVIDRTVQALQHAQSLALSEIVWVTHAGVMRAAAFVHGAAPGAPITSASQWPRTAPQMGQWTWLEF